MTPQPQQHCDGDCLSCDVDIYISCEKRINPDMKYSALERLDIKFGELIGAIEEKQIDGQLSSKDHGDYELVCYCRGFIREELEKEFRSRPIQPPCPYWGIEHSDGMEWVCRKPWLATEVVYRCCEFYKAPTLTDPSRCEKAAQAREKVLKACCKDCPISNEIPTDDGRCAESCEGCLVRSVVKSLREAPR